ncbi:D-alanyl-D-alanine carboxypeptidase family protein [Caloramator australicus]|uniref:serine-type D-Ala-D-Ala carboxypeptidase n=1 Tax=Caloramator australicus RC3 TaxID=857293 RepID=I7K9T4_9CLOT|nr:D-alanyl-D-alanine carboxypeptidase family protein [Caloramator australicus]CCJ34405.1 D-alanyl-D-alanine carboxypeptidase [Caloramator australicus RC3]
MRRIFIVIFSLFILSVPCLNVLANSKELNLNCVAATILDQESGRILYSKNGNKILPMASTTKIMTAIVAIERGNIKDVVTVSTKAASVPGSSAGLRAGDKVTLEELLYGLMLKSGNDAAVAIAEHIAGNVQNFVKLMNDKALEIGALNTSFITPHGLDAEDHFTTANDLAKITAYAMKNDLFAKIVATKEISSGITGPFKYSYNNINKFLFRVDNSDGVKTGYTGNAGKCLVASVRHKFGRYICVVLNSADRWKDAEKLVQYASKNYIFIKAFDRNEIIKNIPLYGGTEKNIFAQTKSDLYLPILPEEKNKIKVELFSPSVLFAPIAKDEIVGNVVVKIDDSIISKSPLISDRDVRRKNFIDMIKDVFLRAVRK